MLTAVQNRAVENLAAGIISGARIPQRALAQEYAEVYTMEFDILRMKITPRIFDALMLYEGSESVVLSCFQQARSVGQYREMPDWRDDLFFFSRGTEPGSYFSFMNRNWPEPSRNNPGTQLRAPWRIFAEVLGACSDLGSWCIFGEMAAEIALIGFRQRPDRTFEEKAYSEFKIRRLADALRDDRFFGEPGNEVSKRQRAILAASYLPPEPTST